MFKTVNEMLFNVMKPGEGDDDEGENDKNFIKQISSTEKKLTKESLYYPCLNLMCELNLF